jgi:hypothetical protein
MIKQHNPISHRGECVVVMCDNDGRALVAVMCLANEGGGLLGGVDIESGGGFVVEDEGSIRRDSAGDGEALLLTAAEDVDGAVSGDAEFIQESQRGIAGVCWCGDVPDVGVIECDLDIFGGGEFVDECEVLEDDSSGGVGVGLLIGRGCGDVA